jgi:putative hydrolase of the HAD superfamily
MSSDERRSGASLRAVVFEPYGTLIDIETDERDWYAYLHLSRFLEYRGIRLSADELRWLWFEKTAHQLARSGERYPDIDARAVWREIAARGAACTHMDPLDMETLIADLTVLHRALTRRTLRPMEGARPLLDALSGRFRLGIVTDGQPDYVLPELDITGLAPYFPVVVISGAAGYRKPDARLFREAARRLDVAPEETLFVGVDTGRDIAGARAAGMRSVLVLTPYGSKDIALGEPDDVADHLADLVTVTDRLSS